MKKTGKFKKTLQRGFTLLELVVVVGIIGILIVLIAPNIAGSRDGSNAALLQKTAQDAGNNWMLISQYCGTTTDAAASPVILATKTAADVIYGGKANVDPAYQACYGQSKVMAMADAGQPSGGGWAVAGHAVTITAGGTVPLKINYAGVPDALVLMMAQKYTPALTTLAASDTTSSVVQYGTATAGTRTVTVLRQVN